jgi:hypothetical protein
VALGQLAEVEGDSYSFMVEKTDQNLIILGVPAFRAYLIEFSLNGSLSIYHSRHQQLASLEYFHFQLLLVEYLALIVLLAVGAVKVFRAVEATINRKIVI